MDLLPLFDPKEFLSTSAFLKGELAGRPLTPAIERELALAEVHRWVHSPIAFITNYCYTVDKGADELLIDPWIGQWLLLFAIEFQRRNGFAQRIIEIKPRQVGWTTLCLAYGFWRVMRPNTKVVALVLDDDVAHDLMVNKVGVMYNALPTAMVPMKRIDNFKQLTFDNPDPRSRERRRGFASSYNITTPSAMRGKTPHMLIASEAAHMKNFDEVDEGLIQAMPMRPESTVIIDTTPASFDDYYYPLVCKAVADNPKWVKQWERKGAPTKAEIFSGALGLPDHPRGYVPVFQPWFWHEQYGTLEDDPQGEMPPLSEQERWHLRTTLGKKEEYGADEEREFVERYGVSLGRIAWRRAKIDTRAGADVAEKLLVFRQEFASTWHGCFVEYSQSPFDRKGLDQLVRMRHDPLAEGILTRDAKNEICLDRSLISEWQKVSLYATPDPSERYVIGVDVAMAYESKNADNSVAVVMRRRDDKVVAIYVAKVPHHILRNQIYLLYRWYNNAYLAVETDGVGYDVPRGLFDMGATNQYYYKRMDADVPKATDYLGWETNAKTRPDMESLLVELIGQRDSEGRPSPGVIVQDWGTLQELQNCKRFPDGRIRGQGKSHDDRVMALMIALMASRDPWAAWRPPVQRTTPRPDTRLTAHLTKRFTEPSSRNRPTYSQL